MGRLGGEQRVTDSARPARGPACPSTLASCSATEVGEIALIPVPRDVDAHTAGRFGQPGGGEGGAQRVGEAVADHTGGLAAGRKQAPVAGAKAESYTGSVGRGP